MKFSKKIEDGYTLAKYLVFKIKNELGQNMTINRIKRITKMLNWVVIILSVVTILKIKKL